MARLQESKQLLEQIRFKALANAMENGCYGTRSHFDEGRVVVTLETVLSRQPAKVTMRAGA